MTASTPIEAARALHRALENGLHGEALRPFFTKDATTTEHPNAIKPRGAVVPLEQMLTNSASGAALLARQRYEVHSAIEHASTAILRLTWTGTVARDVGPFRAGQELTAHIAQFVTVEDGRVAAIETFDCYEPFVRT